MLAATHKHTEGLQQDGGILLAGMRPSSEIITDALAVVILRRDCSKAVAFMYQEHCLLAAIKLQADVYLVS